MTLCPCDAHLPPRLQPIAPGLARLPRQIGLFGQFRADLLARVRDAPALAEWRARDPQDLGLMLLDFWAYVADVTAFYTSELAQDLYLPTARDAASLRKLVALIDHVPRPAVACEALLAALIDGPEPVIAPEGVAFLSEAVGGHPAQVFEARADTPLDPLRNGWTLRPPRAQTVTAEALRIEPGSRNLSEGGLIIVDAGPTARNAFRVTAITPETALDGQSVLRLALDPPALLPKGPLAIDSLRLWSLAQSAPVSEVSGMRLTLEGHLPSLRAGQLIVLEDTDVDAPKPLELHRSTAVTLGFGSPITTGSGRGAVTVPGPPQTFVTLDATPGISAAQARLHFGLARAGKLAGLRADRIMPSDLLPSRPLKDPFTQPDLPGAGLLLLKGVGDAGLAVPGEVWRDTDTGLGRLIPSSVFAPAGPSLRAPVQAHGNVIAVTRGKTVEEVLGAGQGPGVAFQSFTLAKAPLTYLHDPAAPSGRRCSLQVWVDGVRWREVRNLVTAGPEDRVYSVRLDEDGRATITFGDGQSGQPPPQGARNVQARYRYGGGEPPPGPGEIRQVAGPVKGLRRVFNVTAAFGGAPADQPEDIRANAPACATSFDRAVSAADFAALARDWGALAAVAVTEWVARSLREGVVVTAIFEGPSPPDPQSQQALLAHLSARAAEAVPLEVRAAEAVTGPLVLAYRPRPDADPAEVRTALKAAFTHPVTGLLAPRRAAIGGPVFRSALLAEAARVPGVAALLSLRWQGAAMPLRLGLPGHGYFAPSFVPEEVAS